MFKAEYTAQKSPTESAPNPTLPDSVACKECKAELSEMTVMDVSGVPEMVSAVVVACKTCRCHTWALEGSESGKWFIQLFLDAEEKEPYMDLPSFD